MPKVNNPQASKSKIYQVIKLKQVFGYSPDEAEKRLFFNEAVNHIVRRTTTGKDRFNKRFTRYNKTYAKNKGVTRSSVDLTLTGRMLNSFEDSIKKDNLHISIASDQTPKAYGHISGFKGHRYIRNGPVRDFFGLSVEEAEKIKDKVAKGEPSGSSSGETTEITALDVAALRNLFEGVRG